jgi:hypothetical protein
VRALIPGVEICFAIPRAPELPIAEAIGRAEMHSIPWLF